MSVMVDVERKGVEDERSTDRLCTASQSAHFRGRPIAVAAHFRGNTVVITETSLHCLFREQYDIL